MKPHSSTATAARLTTLAVTVLATGCGDPVGQRREGLDIDCSIPLAEVHRGAVRGVIPGIADPELARYGDPGTDYLSPEDRVVGLRFEDEWIAIPHNILWWHEIVNLNGESSGIAVTHCPLTGSSLAFDRGPADGRAFDVSGLLYQNNLMMVDVDGDAESLWPQMARAARCGPKTGTELPMIPIVEMTWAAWSDLHPDTRVVTANTGFSRNYTEYPYAEAGDPLTPYDEIDNAYTLFPVRTGIDTRRPPKERGLGVPDGDRAKVFPFLELESTGSFGAVNDSVGGRPYVVLWSTQAYGGMAYWSEVEGQTLTFLVENGDVVDVETGSTWRIDGLSVEGPLVGTRLDPVADAFVAFWFSWPTFFSRVDIWEAP